ncbi:hypothetical protein PILCRDRAFT_826765 [Piloderma croceum F 1598]|uniref:Uncharacterized protein n=1 Tax=Piloderma croceum (strain F 1598) TaxID=765440 RepID=A0A0C3F7N7_PILCF|nr:hypothetical protein PILCRDRAFT_826765 [Piloderma croceum F 1598]
MMSGLGDLPTPGTPPFFPALLASIRAAAPGLPLDPVVMQALLLCLLAGDKNLILRTREEDVPSVSKLAASTLTSVFGYSTHKLKIRADSKQQTPPEFLRSLFLHSATPAPSSLSVSDDLGNASTTSARHKTVQKRRPRSRPSPPGGTISTTQRQLFQRSHSYPADDPASPLDATGLPSNLNSSSFASRIQHPDSLKTDLQRPVLRPPGVHTDPTPSLQRHFSYDALTLPSALVVTGLEDAGMPAQRSLLKVLSEKRVILEDDEGEWVWNLPDGFIVVYICVADPRERPAIHKSLLDRFAMSTTITLHPSTQQAIRYTLLHHRSHSTSPSIISPSAPIFPDTLLKSLRLLASSPPLFSLLSSATSPAAGRDTSDRSSP